MDVDNDFSAFEQMLRQHKYTLQAAKKRQGQLPRDRKPRDFMFFEFMASLMVMSARKCRKEGSLIHTSFVPSAYLPCTSPIHTLKSITISELRLETHHRGTSLLVRAITPPNRMTGILVLVEDECEDATILQLYQQEEEIVRKATDIIEEGSILLIKEPYFKVMASGDYGLRVDHLSDVVYLDEEDDRVPHIWRPRIKEINESAEVFKMQGNKLMGDEKYWQAVKEYSRALSASRRISESRIILRNRALAYLKTRQYDAALADTGYPAFTHDHTEKALFRAAEALYHLKRFEDCFEVLKILCTDFPENKQAAVVMQRARQRCDEISTGNYDFSLLQKEAKKLSPPNLDHATYIGNIEVRQTKNKGRGLFMNKSAKAGDLLLCEKAFSHAFVDEEGHGNASLTFLMNTETNRGFMGGHADLLRILVQKLYSNPSVAPSFLELHHGSYKPSKKIIVDGQSIIDTFLVERIMSLNVFGCPVSSLKSHKDVMAHQKRDRHPFHSCGIWIKASYINHSCIGNVRRSFIGDMMIVRAAKDLEAGKELTFPYESPTGDHSTDTKEKFKNWEFICRCVICEDSRNTKDSVLRERRRLLGKLKLLSAPKQSRVIRTVDIERLLEALRETYSQPATEVPRLLLWDPQLVLTTIYLDKGDIMRGLISLGKTFDHLGFVIDGLDFTPTSFNVARWGYVVDCAVELFLQVRSVFKGFGSWEKSRQAEQYARTSFRILVGEDVSFDRTYAEHIT